MADFQGSLRLGQQQFIASVSPACSLWEVANFDWYLTVSRLCLAEQKLQFALQKRPFPYGARGSYGGFL